MVRWKCPHCSKRMFSSWEASDKAKVKCIHCGREFDNPYYKPGIESKASQQNDKMINQKNLRGYKYDKRVDF
jgi:DNA-directed RNA polymerase subunit RPC12/RpoP